MAVEQRACGAAKQRLVLERRRPRSTTLLTPCLQEITATESVELVKMLLRTALYHVGKPSRTVPLAAAVAALLWLSASV
jgi:hypothetical protein